MIIWKGLGILVILAGIAGMIIGGVLANLLGFGVFTGAFAVLVAALLNWGLCKLLYRRPARMLVDVSTGQQILDKPSHSLFFIPAYAWTWIFVALTVPMVVIGFAAKNVEEKNAATPGHTEFKIADNLISSKTKGIVHGNSNEAKAAAEIFSKMFKDVQKEAFTGGSKRTLLTGGEFLTYCHHGEDSIVFLCHVPGLRNYKNQEAKDGLVEIAWMSARIAVRTLEADTNKNLIVGLRGASSYGSILTGKPTDEKPSLFKDSSKKEILYPSFIEAHANNVLAPTQ